MSWTGGTVAYDWAVMEITEGGNPVWTIRPANSSEWDTTWSECPYATYFHSREWGEAWQRYVPRRIRCIPQRVEFADGRSAILTLTTQRTNRGLTETVVASPGGTYGGWISADELASDQIAILTRSLLQIPTLVWRVNPFGPVVDVGETYRSEEFTQAVMLNRPIVEIQRGWSKGHRSAANQAERSGVLVREAASPADWDAYFQIYRAASHRWGKRKVDYGQPLFKALFENGSGNRELLLAEAEGRVIAGALILYASRHAVYWHGAARAEFFPFRPVHLLIRESMRRAQSRGCEWFDFNPSSGLEGVQAFKRGFGTTELAAPLITRRAGLAHLLARISRVATIRRR